MTKGRFGDSRATKQDLEALSRGEKAASVKIPETPPPPRGADIGLVDIDDRDNPKG